MATKTKGNSGFRNGELFCFNCGSSQALPLPLDVRLAAEWMKGFAKVHEDCEKTWVEPKADPALDYSETAIKQNAYWWLRNGERGMSSETMFYYFTGNRVGKNETTPSDPDDFRRCYLLLEAVPQWKTQLDKLRKGGEVWCKLVENWDKLTEMMEQNIREDWKNYKKVGMYELMKSLGC